MTLIWILLFACPNHGIAKKNGGEDWIIAIDVGHASFSQGATSARGRDEFYFNLDVGKKVKQALVREGYGNTFTIVNPKRLGDRPILAGKRKADLFISFHHDSVQSFYLQEWTYGDQRQKYCDLFKGYSILVSPKNAMFRQSLLLATMIGKKMKKYQFQPTLHHAANVPGERHFMYNSDLGIYRYDDLVVLKRTTMPAVLIEVGVIVNRDEEIFLGLEDTKNRLSQAIVEGVREFTLAYEGVSPKAHQKSRNRSDPPRK